MKKTITIIITTLLLTFSASSQELYSSNEMIVHLSSEASASPSIIQSLLNDSNAHSRWSSPDNTVQVWEVQGFPFVTFDGTIISNINQNVIHSQDKTEIDGVSLNYQTSIPQTSFQEQSCTQNDYKIYEEQGVNSVKISILDTGISDLDDNSQSGYDFSITSYTGYDYVNEDSKPEDDHGHGSHIAGVIADIANQSSQNSLIFDIRKTHDSSGSGYLSTTIRAIYDAVLSGTNVINMSFSYEASGQDNGSPLKAAIDFAEANNVLVVTSAGNNSVDNDIFQNASFPASFDNENIISTASVSCNNELSWFSNYGQETVDVAIIGENIQGPDLFSGITSKSGTSQATAIVSAISAVLGTHQDSFDPAQIKCVLISTSEWVQSLESLIVSNGIVDAIEANEGLQSDICSNYSGSMATARSSRSISALVYPNPTGDYLHLNLDNGLLKNVKLNITDISGRTYFVKNYDELSGSLQFEVKEFPSGHYTITAVSAEQNIQIMFIKI